MTATNNILASYSDLFKGWSEKHLGPKPTVDQVAAIHSLGLRPGKQALANAMALRPCGVSGSQIVMACGAPQLNRMRGLIASGVVKRDMTTAANEQGHTVYRLTLTAKGEAAIKKASDAAAKAALDGDAQPAKKQSTKATEKKARKAARKAKTKELAASTDQPEVSAPEPTPVEQPVHTDAPAEQPTA